MMPIFGVHGKKLFSPIPYKLLPPLPPNSPTLPLIPRSSIPTSSIVLPRSRADIRKEIMSQSPVVMMLDHVEKGGKLPSNVRLQNWVDKRESWSLNAGVGKERKESLMKRMRMR